MYTNEEMIASIKKVEANRAANAAYEPVRMTAQEKDDILKTYHPDYNTITVKNTAPGRRKPRLYRLYQRHRTDHQHCDRNIKQKYRLIREYKRRKSRIGQSPDAHHECKQAERQKTCFTVLIQQIVT